MGKVVRMYADGKYHNFALYEWVEANARVGPGDRSPARRMPRAGCGCRSAGRSSGRSPGWARCRRLIKDREKRYLSSESFIKLAMIQLMLNRLEPTGTDAEFRYREAA